MPRPFAHVRRHYVGYVALLFAMGGTSYAAAGELLPPNSVGTRQVINHSLLSVDFKAGQLPRGARGPQGPQGPAGATGAQGPPGIVNVGSVLLTSAEVDPIARSIISAFIPTDSSSGKCLITLNEASPAIAGITDYCGTRNYNGAFGILVHILSPANFPADTQIGITVYQESAQRYGPPVFFPPS